MEPIKIMVNGIPGNVASNIAKHVLDDKRFQLLPYSLTGPEITDSSTKIDSFTITLIHHMEQDKKINEIKEKEGAFITIDFTHPTAVNSNADFYCNHNLPFIMGTTGGDRKLLETTVTSSSCIAIIAPNMAKQIIGFQAMMEYAAKTFPDLFKGYSLEIKESHQNGKADTSGTAKEMVKHFNNLGMEFSEEQIQKERNPEVQKNSWKIPEQYLSGHAWHTYTLTSEDKTAAFSFSHNINGRDIYSLGTLDGAIFLHKKINLGIHGKVFTMIDVLQG